MGNNGLLFKNIFALTKMEVKELNRKLNNNKKKTCKSVYFMLLYSLFYYVFIEILQKKNLPGKFQSFIESRKNNKFVKNFDAVYDLLQWKRNKKKVEASPETKFIILCIFWGFERAKHGRSKLNCSYQNS